MQGRLQQMRPILALGCWLLAAPGHAARVDAKSRVEEPRPDGYPRLEIVKASNAWEMIRNLEEWATGRDFGVSFLTEKTDDDSNFFPERISRIAVSRGRRVLIMNLEPFFAEIPQPLPAAIHEFFEDKGRVFYGLGIMDGAARLAFEHDCVMTCVDFRERRWPSMKTKGGLYGMAGRYMRLKLRRPPNPRSAKVVARHAWLHWALADTFVKRDGMPHPDWAITMAEMYGAGPVHLRAPWPRHDWQAARSAWLELLYQREEEQKNRKQGKKGKRGKAVGKAEVKTFHQRRGEERSSQELAQPSEHGAFSLQASLQASQQPEKHSAEDFQSLWSALALDAQGHSQQSSGQTSANLHFSSSGLLLPLPSIEEEPRRMWEPMEGPTSLDVALPADLWEQVEADARLRGIEPGQIPPLSAFAG